jgi:neutral ceramidase
MLRLRFLPVLVALIAACTIQAAAGATGAAIVATPAQVATLLAGTGRATIDPPPSQFPIRNNNDSPLVAIHDSLYSRALVLKDATSTVIVVVADVIILPDDFYDQAVSQISERYAVPKDHVLLSATHTHTVPWTMGDGYGELVIAGMMAAIEQAQRRLEAVRVGSGNGLAYINMNRDELAANGFILGQDPEGASDKMVRVVGFLRGDGSPLAIIANYAVHAVSLYSSDTAGEHAAEISADIPGVVDRFVDEHYGAQRTETLWTSGAAGDQNPILMSFHAEPQSDGSIVTSDMKSAGFMVTQRLGQALALEVIRVTDRLKAQPVTAALRAAQTIISCPSKSDPALMRTVRMSYLGIGPVDLVGVSGEVGTLIDRHLRENLGGRNPLLLTLTNGYAGYLPDDASFGRGNTFEVGKSQVAPGCAEGQIIARTQELLGATAK